MNPISPFVLQAQISPPAGGALGLADTTRLENPFQAPMWIDEVRFRLPGGNQGQAWESLRVELKLGEVPITKGYVPIGLFGKVYDSAATYGEGGLDIFTWKLPKPLFVPARELLRPSVYYNSYSGAPSRTVTVAYACRPLPKDTPTPKILQIPWVTSYQTSFLTSPSAADTTDQTTPADLYNPFDQDLHVQRFVGRLMVQGSTVGHDIHGADGTGYMSIGSANINLSTGLLTTGTLVTAQDSFNNILVRDPTPFGHLFDQIDRAWTVNCVLPPKGFYLFTIDRLWNNYTAVVTAAVGIGMVGYREVPNR